MTKISNAKRASSTKLNALETYLHSWNKKNEDDIVPLQKNMVYARVTCDIDAANKIALSLDGYFDQILSIAENIDPKHGLDEAKLREQFDRLGEEVEAKRVETSQNIELQIESILKDARRYSVEVKPATKEGGGGEAINSSPTPTPSFRFRPLEELAPGEISQDVSPQEFCDWLLCFEDYVMTGSPDTDNIPDKFRVSYFMSKVDKWWKDRLRSEINRDTPWNEVVAKMEEILLATNPLFLRRVNTFGLRQKNGQKFSEFCREHVKMFSLASCEKMTSEDLRLHLILGAMLPGKLRDRLYAEKNLDMKKVYEMTSLFEEAEVKKGVKPSASSNQVKKVAGQDNKKSNGSSCFKCGSEEHLKKDCPQMHNMICGWCQKKFHLEAQCFAKKNGEPKVAPVNKVSDNKKKSEGGKKNPDDISKKEKKLKKKKKKVKSVKSDASVKNENEYEGDEETTSDDEETGSEDEVSNMMGNVRSIRAVVSPESEDKVSNMPGRVRGVRAVVSPSNAQLKRDNRFVRTSKNQLDSVATAIFHNNDTNTKNILPDSSDPSFTEETGVEQRREGSNTSTIKDFGVQEVKAKDKKVATLSNSAARATGGVGENLSPLVGTCGFGNFDNISKNERKHCGFRNISDISGKEKKLKMKQKKSVKHKDDTDTKNILAGSSDPSFTEETEVEQRVERESSNTSTIRDFSVQEVRAKGKKVTLSNSATRATGGVEKNFPPLVETYEFGTFDNISKEEKKHCGFRNISDTSRKETKLKMNQKKGEEEEDYNVDNISKEERKHCGFRNISDISGKETKLKMNQKISEEEEDDNVDDTDEDGESDCEGDKNNNVDDNDGEGDSEEEEDDNVDDTDNESDSRDDGKIWLADNVDGSVGGTDSGEEGDDKENDFNDESDSEKEGDDNVDGSVEFWRTGRMSITRKLTMRRKRVTMWMTLMKMLTVGMMWMMGKCNWRTILADKGNDINREADKEGEEDDNVDDSDEESKSEDDVDDGENQLADNEDDNRDDSNKETDSEDDEEMERWRTSKRWGWRPTTPPPSRTLGCSRSMQRTKRRIQPAKQRQPGKKAVKFINDGW